MMIDKKKNKELCKKYPFLNPLKWRANEGYQSSYGEDEYSYTWLDYLPLGWKISFGEKMCEEILSVLNKYNALDKYRVEQVKEKYGCLCWYDDCKNHDAAVEINDIVQRYENLSVHTCVECGSQDAKIRTKGWVSPYCDRCIQWGNS